MAASPDNVSMAMFCDFENVALGVRDANYEKFDIKPVLERLLLKGSIVLKKAYCDWDRYKGFKAAMHEANFELIEIPHVRQSGKNSADIRMVVDALDLCYTKSHVNTFVIVSGDSDFSPLVSKLRENDKYVIGVGVKQSTSDLLIANCDEFIFYDDLVREIQRSAARRDPKSAQPPAKRSAEDDKRRRDEIEARKTQAVELAVETFDALVAERGDSGKIWASMLKNAIKRRKPDFNESYYGFRVFGNLLEEAQARGLLELGRDEKSGAFVTRSLNPSPMRVEPAAPDAERSDVAAPDDVAPIVASPPPPSEAAAEPSGNNIAPSPQLPDAASASVEPPKRGRRGGGARSAKKKEGSRDTPAKNAPTSDEHKAVAPAPVLETPASAADAVPAPGALESGEREPTVVVREAAVEASEKPNGESHNDETRVEKRPPARNRRPRKPKVAPESAGS